MQQTAPQVEHPSIQSLGTPLLLPPHEEACDDNDYDEPGFSLPPRCWSQRTLGHMRPGSQRSSVFTLVSTAIGAGVLTTPYAMSQMGLVVGTLTIILCALVSFASMNILATGQRILGVESYHDLVKTSCHSPLAASIVDLLIAFNGVGCCISYMVFLGDFLPSALAAFGVTGILTNRTVLLSLSLFLMWPLCIRKRLSSIRHATLLPVVALSFTCVVLLFEAPFAISKISESHEIEFARMNWNFFKCFNVFLFAYMQHMNVCPVTEEMIEPSNRRIWKMSFRATAIELLLYLSVAISGALSFGSETKQNFLQNYPTHSPLIVLCRLLLAASMLVNVPINLIPAVRSILKLIKVVSRNRVSPLVKDRYEDVEKIAQTRIREGRSSTGSGSATMLSDTRVPTSVDERNESQSDAQLPPLIFAFAADSLPSNPPLTQSAAKNSFGADNISDSNVGNLTQVDTENLLFTAHRQEFSIVAQNRAPSHESAGLTGRSSDHTTLADHTLVRVALATCGLLFAFFLALLTDQVADVVSLIGGLFPTPLICTFPAVIFWKLSETFPNARPATFSVSPLFRVFITSLLFLCSIMGYVSAIVVILQAFKVVPSP